MEKEYYFLKKLDAEKNKFFYSNSKYKKYFELSYKSHDDELQILRQAEDINVKEEFIKHDYLLHSIIDIISQDEELKEKSHDLGKYYKNSQFKIFIEMKIKNFLQIQQIKLEGNVRQDQVVDLIVDPKTNRILLIEVYGGDDRQIKIHKKEKYKSFENELKKQFETSYALFVSNSYSQNELTRDHDWKSYYRQLSILELEFDYWKKSVETKQIIRSQERKKGKSLKSYMLDKFFSAFFFIAALSLIAFFPLILLILLVFMFLKPRLIRDLIYYLLCYFLHFFYEFRDTNSTCFAALNELTEIMQIICKLFSYDGKFQIKNE